MTGRRITERLSSLERMRPTNTRGAHINEVLRELSEARAAFRDAYGHEFELTDDEVGRIYDQAKA